MNMNIKIISLCALSLLACSAAAQSDSSEAYKVGQTLLDSQSQPWGVVVFVDENFSTSGHNALAMAIIDQSDGIAWGAGDAQTNSVNANNYGIYASDNTTTYGNYCAANNCQQPAAFDVCKSYNGGGYTDWYLPSTGELMMMFSVSQLLSYPYHLDETQFYQFKSANYWSSTENHGFGINGQPAAATEGLSTSYKEGQQQHHLKTEQLNVRCIRAL